VIRYQLTCPQGHHFDGWFASSSAFDEQRARALVTCPVCGTDEVEKALMAPAVRVSTSQPAARSEPVAVLTDKDRALRDMIRAVRAEVEKTAENVGDRFAEEARRIHDGEVEAKSIYGRATSEEARALVEDGIGFLPLPALPDEKH
jgi:hypothetical protein